MSGGAAARDRCLSFFASEEDFYGEKSPKTEKVGINISKNGIIVLNFLTNPSVYGILV